MNLQSHSLLNDRLGPVQAKFLLLVVIGMFLPIKISNAAMFALLGLWFFMGRYRFLIEGLRMQKIFYLVFGFYGLHLLGLIWCEDLHSGFKELDKKIPMLIFPVVLSSLETASVRGERTRILKFYVLATIITSLILVLFAFYRYALEHDVSVFYYKEFSEKLTFNPVYLAIYVLVAFSIYCYEINDRPIHRPWLQALFFCGVFIMLILLSSKNAIVLFGLISLHYLLTKVPALSMKRKILIVISIMAVSVFLVNSFSITRERIQDVFTSDFEGIFSDDYTLNASSYTGVTLRLSFWRIAFQHMHQDGILLFGVGTGDGTAYLNRAYEQHGLIAAGFLDYNLHNAFMEVLLEFGLAGLAYFVVLIVFLIRFAIRSNDRVLLITLLIFISFSLTEAVLNVNKGIAFFFFFFSFLIASNREIE